MLQTFQHLPTGAFLLVIPRISCRKLSCFKPDLLKMPKTKKATSSSDSDSGPDDCAPPSKKSKPVENAKKGGRSDVGGDDNEKKVWTLERMRQVRINEFRGKQMVDIREFYEKNGEILPGKKGISLSVLQWRKLLEVADEVNKALN